MSTTVDNRVVSMQFDNSHFERNVQTSLGTLEKLKRSLNLTDSAKGLENIGKAAGNINMDGLSSGVETVRTKFSALQVMGVTALANITNAAVNAGKKIVTALTIEPIKAGFDEYETKINAIQTIMSNTASKGTTMEDVTRVIDELNTYADKTIYNFSEMTRNIGTFTAAGVGLEESAAAIQGIANLAAASGSNSQQASTAMYQLSQALAAGTVKLMDWNSVVNAGMGGEKFQNALKETAKEMGTDVDAIIKKTGSFRESLREGWITADVLNTTLKKFTKDGAKEYGQAMLDSGKYTQEQYDALIKEAEAMEDAATKVKTFTQLISTLKESLQSGWGKTWELIIGNFEEAKELWTSVNDVLGGFINASADARNELVKGWADGGGRAAMIEALANAFNYLVSVVKPIKEAFREVFPRVTAEQLITISEKIRDFTEKLKLSSEAAGKIKDTFKGVFSVFSLIGKVVGAAARAIAYLFKGFDFKGLGNAILNFTGNIGEKIANLNDIAKRTDGIYKAFKKVADAIIALGNGIKDMFSGTSQAADNFADKFAKRFSPVQKVLSKIGEVISKIDILGIFESIGSVLSAIGQKLAKAFSNLEFDTIFDFINGVLSSGIMIVLLKFVNFIEQGVEEIAGFKSGILDILNQFQKVLQGYQMKLKAEALIKIGIAIAILSASLVALSMVDSTKLTSAILAMGAMFAMLVASLKAMEMTNITGGKFGGTTRAITTMIGMGVAVLILSKAMKNLADLDIEGVGKGILAIASLSAILIATIKILDSDKFSFKGVIGLILFTSAISSLAKTVAKLGALDLVSMAKGLGGIAVLVLELAMFLKLANFEGFGVGKGIGLITMAIALNILAKAVASFGGMDVKSIIKGLSTVAVVLLELAMFIKLSGGSQKVIANAIALTIIAGAMNILTKAIHSLAGMSWVEMAKGLVAMGGALLIIAGALHLMPKNLMITSVGLVIIASAIKTLAGVLTTLGDMSWIEIAKGMVALGGAMAILAVGLYAMSGTIAGSIALAIAVSSLALLAPVLIALGSMGWKGIAVGLTAIAGGFAVLGIAAAVLTPLIPSILGLAGALALIGIGALAIGAGLALAGAGLTSLAVGIAALASVAGSIPAVIGKIAEGIANSMVTIISSFANAIVDRSTVIAEAVLKLITNILQTLATYVPQIVDALATLVIGIINALGDKMPDFIQAVANLISKFFGSVTQIFQSMDINTISEGFRAVGLLASMMLALSGCAALAPTAMVGVLAMGAVIAELSLVLAAIGALQQIPGLNWIVGEGGKLLQTVGNAIGNFIGGIVGGVMEGISSALPQIGVDLSLFMTNLQPFIDGAASITPEMLSGVKTLTEVILLLTAANIVDGLTSWLTGGSSLASFAEDLIPFGEAMKSFSDSVTGINPDAVSAAANAGKMLAEMSKSIPNSGGFISLFTGNNDLDMFGEQLVVFGQGMKAYGDAVTGMDTAAVTASVEAAKGLVALADTLPNSGGLAGIFAGNNDMDTFGEQLIGFGEGMKSYGDAVADLNAEAITNSIGAAKGLVEVANAIPETGGIASLFKGNNDIDVFGEQLVGFGQGMKAYGDSIVGVNSAAIMASAIAARGLVAVANAIPETGGLKSLITGDTDISSFGMQLVPFGKGMKAYGDAVVGINPTAILASVAAAKGLAEVANAIPTTGGLVSLFTGDNDIGSFGMKLVPFGQGMKAFSDSVVGINPEAVTAAANAGKMLSEMAATLPTSGGVISFFTGETDMYSFGYQIQSFGSAMKAFSDTVIGINPEAVTAAISAGQMMAELAKTLPNTGGVVSFFTGEQDMTTFSARLVPFGEAMKKFSDTVVGLNSEAIEAAASAGKIMAEMAATLPNSGGVVAFFTGEQDMSTFSTQLTEFGKGMKSYGDAVADINPEAITASASAAKALVEVANALPSEGGFLSLFTGEANMSSFADNLEPFGKGLKAYGAAVTDINTEAITSSVSAARGLAGLADVIPESGGFLSIFTGGADFSSFGSNLEPFGKGLKAYGDSVSGLDSSGINTSVDCARKIANFITNLTDISMSSVDNFKSAIEKLGTVSLDKFIDAFTKPTKDLSFAGAELMESILKGIKSKQTALVDGASNIISKVAKDISGKDSKFSEAGTKLMSGLVKGIDKQKSKIKTAVQKGVEAGITDAKSYYQNFYSAGSYLVDGFAAGISANTWKAEAKAKAMANAAEKAAKEALDINSPSKVFRKIGMGIPEGLAMGIDRLGSLVRGSSTNMSNTAINTVRDAISRVSDYMNSDIDSQPTIRPVLDLSDIKSGAGSISELLGTPSVGVMSNIGAISTMMSRNKIQNGNNSEVVSAIKDLKGSMNNRSGDTYNINGVSYSADEEVAEAIRVITRAANMGRRV